MPPSVKACDPLEGGKIPLLNPVVSRLYFFHDENGYVVALALHRDTYRTAVVTVCHIRADEPKLDFSAHPSRRRRPLTVHTSPVL